MTRKMFNISVFCKLFSRKDFILHFYGYWNLANESQKFSNKDLQQNDANIIKILKIIQGSCVSFQSLTVSAISAFDL